MNSESDRVALPVAVAFGAGLAVAALAWYGKLRHPSYIRQVLLTGILAPAALTVALLLLGPSLSGLRAALGGTCAAVFFAAVWAHAGIAWLSLLWTSNAGATLDRAVVLTTLAVWGSAWLLASRGSRWKFMAAAFFVVTGLEAFTGASSHLAQMSLGTAPARLSAPIGNANTVAVLMFFPILGGVAIVVASLGNERCWPWPGLGGAVLAVLATATFCFAGSRSGLVGLAAGLVVLSALILLRLCPARGMSPKWALLPVALAAIGICGGGVALAASAGARAELSYRLRSGSLAARYYGSMASWEIFKENPVGGSGAGTFLSEAPRRTLPERYAGSYGNTFLNVAHNEYAETGAELGVLGLMAFLAVLGGAFTGGFRGSRWSGDTLEAGLSAALCASIAAVAVSSLADPSFRYWDFTGVFYAGAALAAAMDRQGHGRPDRELAAGGPGATVRIVTVFGGVLLAGLAGMRWAGPDMMREKRWLEAHVAARNGDHAAADVKYRAAVRAHGNFLSRVLAHYDWISERAAADRPREALTLAEELDAEMPECPLVLRRLSSARLKPGDYAGALAALVRSGRRDPFARSFPRDFFGVFEKSAQKKGIATAPGSRRERESSGNAGIIEAVRARLRLSGHDSAVLASLEAASRKSWSEAERLIRGMDPSSASFVELDLWRGLLLIDAGRPEEAVAALERHLARCKRHAHGYRHLARAHAAVAGSAGSDGEVGALRLCLKHDVEHEEARLQLVKALVARGEYAQALETIISHLPIARHKARFYLEAAEIEVLRGRPEAAIRLLRTGLGKTRSRRIHNRIREMESGRPASGAATRS